MRKRISIFLFFIAAFLLLLPAVVIFAQNVRFSVNLKRGSVGQDVSRLQEFLKTRPDIYPEGLVTGYFGILTEKAVKRFQAKYGIEQVGIIGPKTHARLNSLISPEILNQQSQRPNFPVQPETKAISKPREIGKQQPLIVRVEQFAALEKELLGAKANGSILAPAHYERIEQDLAALEGKGYSANEIRRLRGLALKLAPYLQDQQKTRESRITTPLLTASSMSTSSPCVSNTNPKFTADITDFSKISKITAPGSPSQEGPKGHSFIWTEGQRVPIYVPASAVLDNGSYGADNINSPAQYVLTFQAKGYCDFQFRFDHIDEPIDTIKAALPSTPKIADSRGVQATMRIEFKAGDLIGYTFGTRQAGNWDFGLYNMTREGVLAGYGSYGIHKYAVCWVDFYTPEQQRQYHALLEGPTLLCSKETLSVVGSQSMERETTKKEVKEPVLKNLGVSFESLDKNTNRAGAFIFLPSENKLFLEYGVEVESSEGGTKILPTFEYRTASDADVFAAIDGVVTNVTYQEKNQDYAIHIQPELNSQWTLEHDHVRNLKVSKGNTVRAGNILGKVGSLGGALGRTEIMLWKSSATRPVTYCPFNYFDPGLISEYQQKIVRHMKDWEEFKSNQNLYSEEKHLLPGCIYTTLVD